MTGVDLYCFCCVVVVVVDVVVVVVVVSSVLYASVKLHVGFNQTFGIHHDFIRIHY